MIIASGALLLFLGDGYDGWRRMIRSEAMDACEGAGAALYAACGFASVLLGLPFLQNFLPLGALGDLFSGGLMLIENAGVTLAVGGGFATVIGGLCAAALVFAWGYFDEVHAHFHVLMLVFMAGMIGFCLTHDVFNMFVWFEVMSVAAFALTGYELQGDPLEGAELHRGQLGRQLPAAGRDRPAVCGGGALDMDALGAAVARAPADPVVAAAFVLMASGLLIGLALLSPAGASGMLLYMAGHGLVKGALFMVAGILLSACGGIDEIGLRGQGARVWPAGIAMAAGGLLLAGLPAGLMDGGFGKIADAAAAGGQSWLWLPLVACAAGTGAAVLRAAGRIFLGWGPVPSGEDRSPTDEEQEKDRPLWLMLLPALVLLAASCVGTAGAERIASSAGVHAAGDARYPPRVAVGRFGAAACGLPAFAAAPAGTACQKRAARAGPAERRLGFPA